MQASAKTDPSKPGPNSTTNTQAPNAKAHPLTHPTTAAAGFSSILGSIEAREIMGNPEQHTQSSSKRRVLIVTACIAAATFALLICAEIFLPSKPPSFSGLGFGPSSTTGFMVLLGPALAAWAFSIYVRCPDATIRNQLVTIAALLAFWLLDVIVKYPMKSDLGTSITYLCYLFPHWP